jgi:hypothetical protein
LPWSSPCASILSPWNDMAGEKGAEAVLTLKSPPGLQITSKHPMLCFLHEATPAENPIWDKTHTEASKKLFCWAQWLKPVISVPATPGGRDQEGQSPRPAQAKSSRDTPSQPTNWAWWCVSVITATWEANR